MTRNEMLTELEAVLNDDADGGVWTETSLLRYLAEGQDKFCEMTGYFTDLSNFSVTLVADTAVYSIPDRVIQIIDIWNGTVKLSKTLMDTDLDTSVLVGMPSAWQTDQETGIIKFRPTPTSDEAGDSLTLQVWRYSQDALNDTDIEPEIPSRFQPACIEWAAYKAFMHHDLEAHDPAKAADHLREFNMYVLDGRLALRRYQNQEVRVGTDPAYRA